MKALVGAFNQEKALIGAFSAITNLRMELFQALLEEVWGRCPKAYQGICVPELPNFFLMFGPNTINNRMFMSECAANLVSDAVLQLARSGRSSMAVRRDR